MCVCINLFPLYRSLRNKMLLKIKLENSVVLPGIAFSFIRDHLQNVVSFYNFYTNETTNPYAFDNPFQSECV